MNTIFSGSKFFRFIDGVEEPEIIRIYSAPKQAYENRDDKRITYFDKDMRKHRMSMNNLLDNYKLLSPDGMLMFSILNIGKTGEDVAVSLQSFKDPDKANEPYAICRQGLYDVFSNMSNHTENLTFIGMSISKDTCPQNTRFEDCMVCTGVKANRPLVIYIDDTLDTILSLFPNGAYDKSIQNCRKMIESENPNMLFEGFCNSLKDLLVSTKFMVDFRRCFGIVELPFLIGFEGFEETEALLMENVLFLEDMFKVNIMDTYVMEYSKDIDLNEIKRKYILGTSAMENCSKLYIIGYDTADGKYVKRTLNPMAP